jgi:hypothetical protein
LQVKKPERKRQSLDLVSREGREGGEGGEGAKEDSSRTFAVFARLKLMDKNFSREQSQIYEKYWLQTPLLI